MKPPCTEVQSEGAPNETAGKGQTGGEAGSPHKEQSDKGLQALPETSILGQQADNAPKEELKVIAEGENVGGKRPQSEIAPNENKTTNKSNNPKIKQPGRWLQDEHERFVEGMIHILTVI